MAQSFIRIDIYSQKIILFWKQISKTLWKLSTPHFISCGSIKYNSSLVGLPMEHIASQQKILVAQRDGDDEYEM